MIHGQSRRDTLFYIHVPFCRSKCAYCGFYSIPLQDAAWRVYFRAMMREIRILAGMEKDNRIVSIYFGGGTPSLMPLDPLAELMDCIRALFHCSEDAEVTLEANPDSAADRNYLKELRKIGVTRLSLGVQSFSDHDLRMLGRRHSADQAVEAVRAARQAGFSNVSLDLLFGLPGQTPKTWLRQLELACRLEPAHISCYALTLEANTPLCEQVSSGRIVLPEDDEQAAMFLQGARYLTENGFDHYEISNFAKDGWSCRHSLGYWKGLDYLGLGPAAVSSRCGMRRKSPRSLFRYADLVGSGTIARYWTALEPRDLANEMAMLRLRLKEGLDLETYRLRTGRDVLVERRAFLQQLSAAGLICITDGFLRLNPCGMLVSNEIIAELFQAC